MSSLNLWFSGLDNQTYVLKSHMHLMCLDVIKEVFPDACFVFTYRKISDVIGSFCSLSETVCIFKYNTLRIIYKHYTLL